MALDAAPDLNELSSELTGVLAHVLGGLHDRVQALEDKLAAESAAKEEAERALAKTAAELHERVSEVAQSQKAMFDASAQMEDIVEDMLTRIEDTEQEHIEPVVEMAEAAQEAHEPELAEEVKKVEEAEEAEQADTAVLVQMAEAAAVAEEAQEVGSAEVEVAQQEAGAAEMPETAEPAQEERVAEVPETAESAQEEVVTEVAETAVPAQEESVVEVGETADAAMVQVTNVAETAEVASVAGVPEVAQEAADLAAEMIEAEEATSSAPTAEPAPAVEPEPAVEPAPEATPAPEPEATPPTAQPVKPPTAPPVKPLPAAKPAWAARPPPATTHSPAAKLATIATVMGAVGSMKRGRTQLREFKAARASAAKAFQDVSTAVQLQLVEKRGQGEQFNEWTETVDRRLGGLEQKFDAFAKQTTTHRNYMIERFEALLPQLASLREAQEHSVAVQKESREQSAAAEQDMREVITDLRRETTRAANEATEARAQALYAAAGGAEIAHLRERLMESRRDIVKLSASKCDKEAIDSVKSRMSAEAESRIATLERRMARLAADGEEKLRAVKQRADERLEAEIAATAGEIEKELSSRLSVLDSKVARKIDAAQEYERLQEKAADDGPTSKKLAAIQGAMSNLLELVLRMDAKHESLHGKAANLPSPSPTYIGPDGSRVVKALPAAATRPAAMHAHRESPVLAHSGAGIVSNFVGSAVHPHYAGPHNPHAAGAHKPFVDGSGRPASADGLRRVESAPISQTEWLTDMVRPKSSQGPRALRAQSTSHATPTRREMATQALKAGSTASRTKSPASPLLLAPAPSPAPTCNTLGPDGEAQLEMSAPVRVVVRTSPKPNASAHDAPLDEHETVHNILEQSPAKHRDEVCDEDAMDQEAEWEALSKRLQLAAI